MFPLILIALSLGAFAYGLSSRVRSRVDDYVRAIRAAHEAHREADVHLSNANRAAGIVEQPARTLMDGRLPRQDGRLPTSLPSISAPSSLIPAPPSPAPVAITRVDATRGVDHAIAATVANQRAAQSTADAARIAQTGFERSSVADSAAKVLERGKRIEEALANLGVGQCGVRSYEHVTPQIRDAIFRKLHAEGMTVTGNDPWDIDTQIAGVKLRAVWDPEAQVLKLIVTASSLLASCEVIWQRIDGALRGIIGS